MKKIFPLLAIVLLGAGCSAPAMPSPSAPLPPTAPTTFSDEHVSFTIPRGWAQVPQDQPGIRLQQDAYFISVQTEAEDAGPIAGGRFPQGISYLSDDPSIGYDVANCYADATKTTVTDQFSRVDLYFDTTKTDPAFLNDACGKPKVGPTLWFGSHYILNCPTTPSGPSSCDGYIMSYDEMNGRPWPMAQTPSLFVSVGKKVGSIADVPVKGDPEIERALDAADDLVRSLKVDPSAGTPGVHFMTLPAELLKGYSVDTSVGYTRVQNYVGQDSPSAKYPPDAFYVEFFDAAYAQRGTPKEDEAAWRSTYASVTSTTLVGKPVLYGTGRREGGDSWPGTSYYIAGVGNINLSAQTDAPTDPGLKKAEALVRSISWK